MSVEPAPNKTKIKHHMKEDEEKRNEAVGNVEGPSKDCGAQLTDAPFRLTLFSSILRSLRGPLRVLVVRTFLWTPLLLLVAQLGKTS
jgi:hypothetical protein